MRVFISVLLWALSLRDSNGLGFRLDLNFEVDGGQCGQDLLWNDLLCGKYQGTQGHSPVPALHSDSADAVPDFICIDEARTAKHVVQVSIRWQHNLSSL